MAARGARVAVVTIDPARRLANALGLQELENEPRRVDPARLGAGGEAFSGELWAMMLDPKRTFDELIDRVAADPARADEIKRNRVYRSSRRRSRARRSSPPSPSSTSSSHERRFRPARARHAPVAQRAGLPRGAGTADLVSGGPRAAHARSPDRPGHAGARPRRLAAAGRAAPGHRRRPAVGPVDVLRAARRHDRRLQRSRRPGGADAARPDDHVPARDRRAQRRRSTRRSGSGARCRPAACRSAA